MHLRPLHDRLVVKRIKAEEKTKGGILIPDVAKVKASEGEVVAVGSGRTYNDGHARAIDVGVGQRVLFGKFSGSEVEVDGERYVVMMEDDVLAVVGDD